MVMQPNLSTSQARVLSRWKSGFLSRIDGAAVVSETFGNNANNIVVEGNYKESDPTHSFKITIILIPGTTTYAISELEEYATDDRLLNRITNSDFQEIHLGSQNLWVPRHTVARTYKYDDYEGNSVQTHKLEILDATSIAVDKTTFSLDIPHDALKYDAVVGNFFAPKAFSIVDASILEGLTENLVRGFQNGTHE